jgi:aldehyde:ferredoxin oxidoreductase
MILRINLTSGTHRTEILDPYVEDYLGGRGIGARILWNELPAGTDPLGPDNLLIFSNGPLAGTAAPSSSRVDVTAKSPLNGFHAVTNFGGFWGAELRHAGYQHLVLSGKSETPVYLHIDNEEVRLCDASHLWGLDTYETTIRLRAELGDENIQVLSIGPAGEKMVHFANLVTSTGHAAGRFGMGAVMGSKGVKAIAVRGTRGVDLADPGRFLEVARDTHRWFRELPRFKAREAEPPYAAMFSERFEETAAFGNYESGKWDDFSEIGVEAFFSKHFLRKAGCFGCFMQCKSLIEIPEVGYGLGGCTDFSSFVGTVWNDDLTTMWEAIIQANRLGLDVIETSGVITLLMELYEQGIITTDDTDGIPMEKGSRNAILETIAKIARREGIGDTLALGMGAAAATLDTRAPNYVVDAKGLYPHGYAFHAFEGASLMQAVGNADPFPTYGTGVEQRLAMPGPWEELLEEAVELYGSEEAYLPGNYSPAKVRMAIDTEHRSRIPDLFGVCLKPYHQGGEHLTTGRLLDMYQAATGRSVSLEELFTIVERLVNLERLIDAREGLTREHDKLPKRFFKPLAGGVHDGKALDHEKMERMKEDYYRARGWDTETGLPTEEKLQELGLD